ncbi:MAG: ATP-binding protein [Bulleidia sp.]
MRKRLPVLFLTVSIITLLIFAGKAYFGFVSQTIYDESTAHLQEIFHQANQSLHNLVSVNWSRMRMWAPFISQVENTDELQEYLNQARQESGFTDFCFISENGNYMTQDGRSGYLDLRDQLSDLIVDQKPVAANSVVPDKPEIMVFAIPTDHGTFNGFEYDAIAITFNNSDMVETLQISAFDGEAGTYAVLQDGRIVVDNGSANMPDMYNIFAFLETKGNVSEEQIHQIETDFTTGTSGDFVFDYGGRMFYFVYEAASFQDWMVVGIVPTEVVNSSMNRLQASTVLVLSLVFIAICLMIVTSIVEHNRRALARKDTELIARDELFSKLSNNVDDVFMMIDAENLKAEYVSPNVQKLTGLSETEIREDIHVLSLLLLPDTSSDLFEVLPQLQPGEQREWDREYIHKIEHRNMWFRVVVFCTDIQGKKKYIMDLSDRTKDRLINQKLEDAVRTAEAANRAKTTFLNNMSHDIRTPMNAIIGFTNIAMKHEPKEDVKACLRNIAGSSEHLLTLINDVLDISRIESGKVRFVPMPVDIRSVAETAIGITHGFLADRAIIFNSHVQEPEYPYVNADAVRIREVLVNILGNAVKFTDDDHHIDFYVSYHPGKDEKHIIVRYVVSDTGVGMTQEFVEHIFDEFSQEENSARTQYRGTGLGMTITKRYVDMMNGSITVESEKGKGSTFTVELPLELTDSDLVQKQEVDIPTVNLSEVHILLAEDNDLNAEVAMVQLEELGVRITRAHNGKEALEMFSNSPEKTFDLILMDVMMPEMNGYEATSAIRNMKNRADARNIPIIAMTANAFAEDVQASLDAGMNGHIAKPIDIEEVKKAIAMNVLN